MEALDDEALHRVLHEQALELDEIVRTWVERFGDRRGSRIVKVDNATTNGVDLDRIIRKLA